MCGFSKPKVQQPPAPPPPVVVKNDKKAEKKTRGEASKNKGAASTILTDAGGILESNADNKKTILV